MKVSIHPAFNVYYYSFYIEGLARTFGSAALSFGGSCFPALGTFSKDCLAFVVWPSGIRVCIDARDGTFLDPTYVVWSDVYAKVNSNVDDRSVVHARKILPIGPSFGVRVFAAFAALVRAHQTAMNGRSTIGRLREHFANYWRQYRYRLPESAYVPGASDGAYAFFAGSLWHSEPECNEYRARFIRACRQESGLTFEGGFAPRNREPVDGYDDCMVRQRYPLSEYLAKVRRSAVAFNTPAVAGCHSWKLGEFLALGKAIVSTPLLRGMPAPLMHGQQVHYVDGSSESIRDAVARICRDQRYRQGLEKGARDYYRQHLAPESVIQSTIALGETVSAR